MSRFLRPYWHHTRTEYGQDESIGGHVIASVLIFLTMPAAFALGPDPACAHRIYFLPQTHAPTNVSYVDISPERGAATARSQLKIVNFLDRFPQLPVFSEQANEDMDTSGVAPDDLVALRRKVADRFPLGFDFDPRTLNESQEQMLVDNGADTVQLMRGRLDVVHRVVEDQATDDRIFGPINAWRASHPDGTPYPPEIARLVYGEREREALRQVNAYFKAQPGTRDVALIYGANHNFSFYADQFPPRCIIVPAEFRADWDGQYRVGPEGFSPEAMSTGVIHVGPTGAEH